MSILQGVMTLEIHIHSRHGLATFASLGAMTCFQALADWSDERLRPFNLLSLTTAKP